MATGCTVGAVDGDVKAVGNWVPDLVGERIGGSVGESVGDSDFVVGEIKLRGAA